MQISFNDFSPSSPATGAPQIPPAFATNRKYFTAKNELLENATAMKSDRPSVRKAVAVWSKILNCEFFNHRPILALFSKFSSHHRAYHQEVKTIKNKPEDQKIKIKAQTETYGGETEDEYVQLTRKYETEIHSHKEASSVQIGWCSKSDSVEAARKFAEEHKEEPNIKIAITNFANPVRVGGADSTGGKGSQEEQIFRKTLLRVSLEHAESTLTDEMRKTQSATGRYIPYYGAVVSEEIPISSEDKSSEVHVGVISASAPDLRRGIRAEGKYFAKLSHNKDIVLKEVLYRKLTVIMMSAALKGYNVLVLGAFGCGAFGNDPKTVAEVLRDILSEERFKGVFTHIIMPIGEKDRNRAAFEKVLGSPTVDTNLEKNVQERTGRKL